MRVMTCPICGRSPKIIECQPTDDGIRRRLVAVNCYHDIIYNDSDNIKMPWFMFYGEGDDNTVYKEWNRRLSICFNFGDCIPLYFLRQIKEEHQATIERARRQLKENS